MRLLLNLRFLIHRCHQKLKFHLRQPLRPLHHLQNRNLALLLFRFLHYFLVMEMLMEYFLHQQHHFQLPHFQNRRCFRFLTQQQFFQHLHLLK